MITQEVDINFDLPEIVTDPVPTYDLIRSAGRVVLNKRLGVWMVPGYEDVLTVLHTPAIFSNAAYGMGELPPILDGAEIMINADPPKHQPLRKVALNAFVRRSLRKMEDTIQQVVTDLLDDPALADQLAGGGEAELVNAYCRPLPAQVIARLLGVPLSDLPDFVRWSDDLSALMDSGQRGTPEFEVRWQRGADSGVEMKAYLTDQINRHRREEHDDLINDLLVANENGILDDKELLATCVLLMIAGNETTTKLIGTSLRLLGSNPDVRRSLVEDPSLTANAVEEILRYEGVTTIVPRNLTQDTTLAGVDLPAGSIVMALLGAANRDPEAFEDPNRFDISRHTSNRHVAFGHGIHLCLGNQLARMEARLALSAFLNRYPTYELGDWQYRGVFLTRGLDYLKISVGR
ncbi:cytochrome P450 [Frankia sp. AgB1.9]|uniref:cytochrome P450 n=1 Tax=unclassified Frankia TaxID=2632575 RepID=UPI0019341F13|nr:MULTISPECIES: cytochrome P450 [unclassified Frankia]MBL7490518.1 cytochrome P450 [Frankia sp. AgW1.1]MBL7551076.1 cytochrome P450 [Frankia sp. AgB1.9]MBL7621232.1 cytochrome P450 [Frankia sp. AgB1.8]